MKTKFFSFLMLALFAGFAANAFAQEQPTTVKVTFVVDDPARVSITVVGFNDDEPLTLTAGNNVFDVNPWSNVTIAPATTKCILTSVTNQDGETKTIGENGKCGFMIYDSPAEQTYTIVSEAATTVNFTFKVDEAAKVKVIDAKYNQITLQNGVNNLSLESTSLPIGISAANWGDELYKVTLDGVEVKYNYGYSVKPQEGSTVDVQFNFPDEACTLDFAYATGITDFFTTVLLNGVAVDFSAPVQAKLGDKVKIYFNSACWESNDLVVTLNGDTIQWFAPGSSLTLRSNSVVEVKNATPVTDWLNLSVKINIPSAATVYRCSDTYKDILTLSPNTPLAITLPESESRLIVEANSDNDEITGVTINGAPVTVDYPNYVEFYVYDDNAAVVIYMKDNGTTSLPSATATEEQVIKRIENGQVVILRGNQRLNVLGQTIE